jgi:hypothetical protein
LVYGLDTLTQYDPQTALFRCAAFSRPGGARAFEVEHMSDAKYREYLETLGEDKVRHQLANQMLMGGRDGIARTGSPKKPWHGGMLKIVIV